MTVKWNTIGKGLQTTYHESRKYGKRFDRCIISASRSASFPNAGGV
ncbi:MAG TPA: hypothetical protein VKA69_05310 [Desulfobacteria bacterium]|nr:hypothetical protein [Desulfobacteria bacterium]